MPALNEQIRRIVGVLLTDPRVVSCLTLAYIILGFAFVYTDYTMHDEGLLTHYWASWARQEFIPVFFFQKVKPVIAALYAPFTAGGVHATMTVHVLVSAAAIPMMAATARALGHSLPNLPAIVLMFSPIYLYGGSSGLSNIDGVAGIALALYLLTARDKPFLAGLVAGAVPWVRFELAVFAAFFGLYALISKRHRWAVVGLAVFPITYAVCGALYHSDLLWIAHFPPSAPVAPNNPIFGSQKIGLRYFLEPALAVTPIAALVVALRLSRLDLLEKILLFYAAAAMTAANILPMFGAGGFGDSPRYTVHVLPALALLLGRTAGQWWDGERPNLLQTAAIALAAVWITTRQTNYDELVIVFVAYAGIVLAARLRQPAWAMSLALALVIGAPLLPVRHDVGRRITASYLDPIAEWLEAHPEVATDDTPIYTNSQMLAPFLEGRGHAPKAGIYFVTGADMSNELNHLTNPENGQLEILRNLAATDLYGRTIEGPLSPDDLPPNALLAFRVESRLHIVFPKEVWDPRLEVLADTKRFRVAKLRAKDNPQ